MTGDAALVVEYGANLFLSTAPWILGRLASGDVLRSEIRQRILETLRRVPGCSLMDLSKLCSFSKSRARHHLRVLQKFDAVDSVRVGKQRCFFLRSESPPEIPHREILLRRDGKLAAVLDTLSSGEFPAQTIVDQLRKHWGMSRSGGWRVIERGARLHILLRFRRGNSLFVRSQVLEPVPGEAPSGPAPNPASASAAAGPGAGPERRWKSTESL